MLILKKIRYILLSVICILSIYNCLLNTSFAQEIKRSLSTYKCDTNAIDQYIRTANVYMETHNDSVPILLNQALKESYLCGNDKRIIKSLAQITTWQYGHNASLAISYGYQTIEEYNRRKITGQNISNKDIYKVYNVMARSYEAKGIIDSTAYFFYLLNDEIANGSDTSKDFAVSVYSQLALFWLNTNWDINSGYIEPTKEFIEKSRQAEKSLPDSSVQAYTSYMLEGAYYLCIKQFDSSRYYFLKYLDLRKKNNTLNVTWYAAVYLNIAETYMLENNPEMALVYLDKTMELKEKLSGFQRYLTITKLYYARAYYQLKKYKAGIDYFESAISNKGNTQVIAHFSFDLEISSFVRLNRFFTFQILNGCSCDCVSLGV